MSSAAARKVALYGEGDVERRWGGAYTTIFFLGESSIQLVLSAEIIRFGRPPRRGLPSRTL